ncbi:alpha-defensin 9-like [Mesocricetus auratus]|uniref:Alpha-defensin 9-like n=1 Tax=Mesocricetus auratus TaxID=10036 RepID=A0A3Q0DAC6_MESAU|nr:alpha-defensin 9-like [Mesocricetus auratus]
MKTHVLLSALVLLAFQALVDPLPEATEEAKNEEQPGVEDQDVSISCGGPEGSVLQAQAAPSLKCNCRKKSCKCSEQVSAVCYIDPVTLHTLLPLRPETKSPYALRPHDLSLPLYLASSVFLLQ